ncbi:hypothetical protein IH781_02515 [Patescibacteria group bacterium]|nr:hypothetical protein [Patescibacteria group bacterium]
MCGIIITEFYETKLLIYIEGGEEQMRIITKRTLAAVTIASFLVVPGVALAQGLATQVIPPGGTQTGSDLPNAITNILNALLVLVAIAALIMLIIGGVRYIFSGGDEEKAAAAKNTILYALVGLVVIALAAVAVNFILQAVGPPTGP